jgi:hypothetical protein
LKALRFVVEEAIEPVRVELSPERMLRVPVAQSILPYFLFRESDPVAFRWRIFRLSWPMGVSV